MFEIRNYTIRPERFATYKVWARDVAVPHLAKKLDLVGFWVNTDDPVQTVNPSDDPLGPANVTWILRWPDQETREQVMSTAFVGKDWEEVFAQLPGAMDNYARIEVKFAESLA
jgi:hypothetical protein